MFFFDAPAWPGYNSAHAFLPDNFTVHNCAANSLRASAHRAGFNPYRGCAVYPNRGPHPNAHRAAHGYAQPQSYRHGYSNSLAHTRAAYRHAHCHGYGYAAAAHAHPHLHRHPRAHGGFLHCRVAFAAAGA